MRILVFVLLAILLFACNQKANNNRELEIRIDSLEQTLKDTYKPGLGEFMSNIQVHHAKLWFAGQNKNWKLADFEIHEIMESIEDIKKFNSDRPETKSIKMINPAIDSLSYSIQQKNPGLFKNSFMLLTTTCNNCHRATNHEFNVIKIPDTPPVSNQEFNIQ